MDSKPLNAFYTFWIGAPRRRHDDHGTISGRTGARRPLPARDRFRALFPARGTAAGAARVVGQTPFISANLSRLGLEAHAPGRFLDGSFRMPADPSRTEPTLPGTEAKNRRAEGKLAKPFKR